MKMLNMLSTVEIEHWRALLVKTIDAAIVFRIAAMRVSVDNVLWLTNVQIGASRKMLDGNRRKSDGAASPACGAYILCEDVLWFRW